MASMNNLVVGVILTFMGYVSVNHSALMEKSDVLTRNEESKLSRWKFNNLLNSIANINKERLRAMKKFTQSQKYNTAQGVLRLSDEIPIVVVIVLNKSDKDASAVYEIYDSNMKNTPGETPVKKVILQIKDYYDDVPEKDDTKEVTYSFGDDGDLDKLYGINHYIRKARENKIDPRDGEEMNPITKKFQVKEVSYSDKNDNKETASKSGQTNPVKKTSKTTVKEDIYRDIKNLKVNGTVFDNKDILRLFSSCTKKVIKTCKKACKSARNSVCDTYKCSSGMKKSFKKHCKSACKAKFED